MQSPANTSPLTPVTCSCISIEIQWDTFVMDYLRAPTAMKDKWLMNTFFSLPVFLFHVVVCLKADCSRLDAYWLCYQRYVATIVIISRPSFWVGWSSCFEPKQKLVHTCQISQNFAVLTLYRNLDRLLFMSRVSVLKLLVRFSDFNGYAMLAARRDMGL